MMLMNGAGQMGGSPLPTPVVDNVPAAPPAPAAADDNEVVQMNAQGGMSE